MMIAIIRPIYKSGDKTDVTNYRPISILLSTEKVLEEVIKNKMMVFIQKYRLINDQQYGFQTGKNINKLLGDFEGDLYTAKSKRDHSLIIFIEFKKAFDT